MFASFSRAFASLFDPALLRVVLKSLLLTILLFAVLLAAIEFALHVLPTMGAPEVNRALELVAPILAIMGFFAMGAPVAAIFASFYLDEVAEAVEARCYADDLKAPGAPFLTGLSAGLRLAGLVVGADLLLLPMDVFLPGIAQIATIAVNGFLLGREYFELAALRHLPRRETAALRKKNSARVFGAGLVISILTVIPLVNFIAPLYGAALMVHLYKRIAHEEART
jgi:CysZ protein